MSPVRFSSTWRHSCIVALCRLPKRSSNFEIEGWWLMVALCRLPKRSSNFENIRLYQPPTTNHQLSTINYQLFPNSKFLIPNIPIHYYTNIPKIAAFAKARKPSSWLAKSLRLLLTKNLRSLRSLDFLQGNPAARCSPQNSSNFGLAYPRSFCKGTQAKQLAC